MSRTVRWYEMFFGDLYAGVLGSERHEAKAPAEALLIKRLLRLRKGQRVLDCPCGLGRIAFQLAKLGLDVTGADLAASYVRRAQRRAKREGTDVRFIRCDMRELPFDRQFHAVVNWFTSFGYFDEAGNLAAAKAAHRALKPGGRFLVELMNKSSMLAHFRRTWTEQVVGGVRIVNRARWNSRANRVRDTWIMSQGRRRRRRSISLRVYNGGEMRALLRKAGFREIRLFGRPPLGPLTRHSRRMIAVARRPLP